MKLVRTVSRRFRREKMVQTVTWLSGLPKEFVIWLVNKSIYVYVGRKTLINQSTYIDKTRKM